MSVAKKLIFRMKDGRTPVSWELPIRNVMLPKWDEKSGQHSDKLIHYLPGAPSIWKEDYKGDGESKKIEFEDGLLDVSPTDVLKIEILKKHPWFNIHYELIDEDTTALKEMENFDIQDKAVELIKETDPLKLKAIALVIIGQHAFSWTETMCNVELRKKALTKPSDVIDEFKKENYEARYIVALSLLKNIIKTNLGHTAVVWTGTGETIIRLAVGENAIDKLSQFLSVQTEEAMITLQRLAELANGNQTSSSPLTQKIDNSAIVAAKDAELSEKDKQIEELKRQLAEKNNPPALPSDLEDKGTDVGTDATIGSNTNGVTDATIEELQSKYIQVVGKNYPPPMKNNAEWLATRIAEAEAAKQ